jgi:hypothetical protein
MNQDGKKWVRMGEGEKKNSFFFPPLFIHSLKCAPHSPETNNNNQVVAHETCMLNTPFYGW